MSIDDATNHIGQIDQLVYDKTGQPLTDLQRLLLTECWKPGKKTYEAIATQNNYSSSYIQQRVAPGLWGLLSELAGQKVTKSNCKNVLLRYLETVDLEKTNESDRTSATDPKGPLAGTALSGKPATDSPSAQHTPEVEPSTEPTLLEFPTESVPLGSRLYIQRNPYESQCCQIIRQSGALIRIKGPRQMGKTSLMIRIVDSAKDYLSVIINFQQTERTTIASLDKLLRWLCANIAYQLKLPPMLDEFWDEDIGSKMSCTLYLEDYILDNIDRPLILVLEESSELFEYVDVSKECFSMLRTWHEYTKHQDAWKNLRLILIQSTETYVPLNVNQSPFNVGFEVPLTPFNEAQVIALAERSGVTLTGRDRTQLISLVGGHPYLIRLALYHLSRGTTNWQTLIATASSDEGIFSNHLQRHLWNLQQHAMLCIAFRQVIDQTEPVRVAQDQGFKLHSMGLVTLVQNQIQVSCELYQQYFSEHL
ncbi:MAG: AAA-like domain-containing protein [Cyanobacteria bacterium J06621_3]